MFYGVWMFCARYGQRHCNGRYNMSTVLKVNASAACARKPFMQCDMRWPCRRQQQQCYLKILFIYVLPCVFTLMNNKM